VIKKLYHLTGIELTPILAINQQQQTCTFFYRNTHPAKQDGRRLEANEKKLFSKHER